MTLTQIIFVSGGPASGKTYLARKLASKLCVPFLSRDVFKETLFDTLGFSDRSWSRKLGGASYELLWNMMENLASSQVSFIAESNFQNTSMARSRIERIFKSYPLSALEIRLCAPPDILVKRFVSRAESGERHPGHVDTQNYNELTQSCREGFQLLDFGVPRLELDTAEFSDSQFVRAMEFIREHAPRV